MRHEGVTYRRDLDRRRKAIVAESRKPSTIAESPRPAPPPPAAVTPPAERHPPAPAGGLATAEKDGASKVLPPPAISAGDPRPPDLARLSPEERRQIGAELSRLIVSDHRLREDAAAVRRLEDLLAHLAEGGSRPIEPVQFHVLDTSEVDAFSHIGGHVYVSRGIFALAQTDAELEFVLAHELAHGALGHAAKRLEAVVGPGGAPLGLVPALHRLIAMGYPAEQEYEADRWAYQALRRAGRSHRQSIDFLRRYAGYADAHGLGAGRRAPKTQPGDSRQDVENHYPAHPPARERLRRLNHLA